MSLEKVILLSHAIAGGLTLASGLMAAFVGKKGEKLHRQVGQVFFWSMSWIFVSSLIIVSLLRFNFFLLIIAVFSFYMTFSGYRALKIKKSLKVEWYDWAASIVTMLFGFSLMVIGVRLLVLHGYSNAMAYLSLFFGFFTLNTGRVNFQGFRAKERPKMWWWFAHMNSMCGALIASITAFLVQNGEIFGVADRMNWMLWVLPALIGSPMISYWARKYRKQFGIV